MRSFRSWWQIFLLCSFAVLLALAWITSRFIGLEQAEQAARAESEHQSSLRLALWRIDSWLGPLLTLEAARPYTEYLENETNGQFDESPGFVLVHFQVDPADQLTSPELMGAVSPEPHSLAAIEHLATVKRIFTDEQVEQCVIESERTQQLLQIRVPESDLAVSLQGSRARSDYELSKRKGAVQKLAEAQNQVLNLYPNQTANGVIRVGTFLPLWFGRPDEATPHLMFVRRVVLGGEDHFQGFLCDWSALHAEMQDQIRDLFPECQMVPVRAELTPTEDPDSELAPDSGSLLATLPASLEAPPQQAGVVGGPAGSTRTILGLSWLAVLGGLAAFGVAFRSTSALAEKRARFAAAVTHELRTPLTTFQMYTDMLAQGMVTDPVQRTEYIETLRDESDRLSRLVENVLAYSQLEQGRRRAQLEEISVGGLIERLAAPLVLRAENTRLGLEIDVESCQNARMRTDVDAIGQILFNLVDNACKYAGTNSGEPLRIECRERGNSFVFELVDHGPGISNEQRSLVFNPFERGARTSDRPGIGIGLALSRGLARDLGGELRLLEGDGPGARFELAIPR